MANFLSLVGFVAVLVLFAWLANRYEPHWCAKDGQRFTCRIRVLHTDERMRTDAKSEVSRPAGMMGVLAGGRSQATALTYRWREARAFVDGDLLQLVTRVGPARRPLPAARVLARAEQAVNGRWVYLLATEPMRELRVPAKSLAVTSLDRLVELSSGNRPG